MKTELLSFASSSFDDLWKLIHQWLENEQKTYRIDVTSVGTYQTLYGESQIKYQFSALVFYIKHPK